VVPNEYFQTDHRRQQLERARALEKGAGAPGGFAASDRAFLRQSRYGTVGCVALDRAGNLAAGTSTGGMTNKKFGRVGDVPVIGAGTYASNATCAVSATGWGEYFIRVGVARDIAAQLEYQNKPLAAAAAITLAKVKALGGDGGVIALDAQGNVAMEFNSPGMYRAHRMSGQPAVVAIYGDEAKP
jgi:beta-aspartyl-peptidase (threonine type)